MIHIQYRGMATLKDIAIRLKSVKNIQKITASMKMVSASKYNRAERDLKTAKPYGEGARSFYEKADIKEGPQEASQEGSNTLLLGITSDRGLCGAANSSIVKAIKEQIKLFPENSPNVKIIPVGDKGRSALQRLHSKSILMHFNDIGKKPATFADASKIAECIISSDFKFDIIHMYYNVFKTVVSYHTTEQKLFPFETIVNSEKFALYDSVDEFTVTNYNEFTLASLIFSALKEGQCSEQSSRMTAMDGASKNASEMIDKLTLTYNRTRQAVITRELTEIVSGAAAV